MRRQANWICHILHRICLLKHVIVGRMTRTGGRGRRRNQLLDNLQEMRGYWKLKKELYRELTLEETMDLS
jgi:hypothetical protein